MESSFNLVKRCRVCGDKASGFNYSGLCCESCKIFFFRNVSKQSKLRCAKEDNCEIDIFTRKICSKCRLSKCFASGMKSTGCSVEKLNKLNYNVNNPEIRKILECLDRSMDPFEHVLPSCAYLYIPRRKKYASDLMAQERQLISNMQNAMHSTFVDENNLQIIGLVTDIVDSFNLSGLYIRSIIRFCKSIPAFKQLSEPDQLLILKPFYYEILMCRFAYLWDYGRYGYPIIQNESASSALFINFEIAKLFKNQEIIQESVKFQFYLHKEMESDFTIRDLLIASMLFKPRDNIENQEHVRYQHSIYCRLLRRYLEHKYKNVQQAERKYSILMKISDDFSRHRLRARELVLSEIDFAEQLSQILIELFDLST